MGETSMKDPEKYQDFKCTNRLWRYARNQVTEGSCRSPRQLEVAICWSIPQIEPDL